MRKTLFLATLLPWLAFTLLATPSTAAPTATPIPVFTSTVQPTPTPTVTPNSSTLDKSDWLVILPAILTFLAAVMASCSWPITILLLLIILRRPMLDRLDDLKLFRFKDFEFEFGRRVQKLEEDADQANLPPTRPVSKPEEGELPASERAEAEVIVEHQNRLYRLAELNPRGAIIEAWVLVESALRQAAKEAQLDVTAHTSTNRVLNLLRQREIVSPQVLKLLDQLRVLRNYAAHERDFKTSTDEVINYIDVSLRVSNALRQPFFQDGEADNI